MFQRFTVVMEYEQKPVLPPPFIIISHVYMLVKYVLRKLRGQRSETYDNGLKLFLEADDLERLHDFGTEYGYGVEWSGVRRDAYTPSFHPPQSPNWPKRGVAGSADLILRRPSAH